MINNTLTSSSAEHAKYARVLASIVLCISILLSGCGKTVHQAGTEQLLTSDAVDRAIAQIDFTPLRGQRIFLDTQYARNIKTATFVNADYIISATRQQLLAAGCLLQETEETADYILEARVGALGNNAHELTYGIPANNSLGAASAAISGVSTIPTIPEISFARKNNYLAAAKVGYFAYDRVTREPVWQSGPRKGMSRAREFWVFGAGPFQSGEVFDGTLLAGAPVNPDTPNTHITAHEISYWEPHQFKRLPLEHPTTIDRAFDDVQPAGHTELELEKKPPERMKEDEKPESKEPPKRRVDPAIYRKPPGHMSHSQLELDGPEPGEQQESSS